MRPGLRLGAVIAWLMLGLAAPPAALADSSGAPSADSLEDARCLLARGRYRELFVALDHIVAEAPADARDVQSGASTLRARALADMGRLDEARAASAEGLRLLVGTAHVEGLVDHLLARSDIERTLGRTGEAERALREAERWLEALGDHERGLQAWLARARLALRTGRTDEAGEAVARARRSCRAMRDSACLARVSLAEGRVALARGDLHRARRRLLAADAAFARSDARRDRVGALRSLVDVYAALERPDRAAATCSLGLEVANRVGHARGRARLERRGGELALARGDREEARRHLDRARRLFRSMGALPGLAASRLVLARLAEESGRLPEARIHLRAARRAFARTGDARGRARALRALARTARAAGDTEEEGRWLEVLADGPGRSDWRIAARLGALALEHGDRDEAVERLREAVDAVEDLGALHASRDDRERLRTDRLATYDRLVAAWLRGPLDEERIQGALRASERALATGYRDLLERADLRRAGPEVRRLLDALDAVDERMDELSRAPAVDGEASRALLRLGRERAALDKRIRALDPDLERQATERLGHGVAEAVETVRRRVDDPVVVLKYHLAPSRSHLFVVRRGRVETRPLADRETLEGLATAFHRSLQQPARTAKDARERRRLARSLYDHLLAPAEALLDGRTRVVVIPHRGLRLVPFGALMPEPGSGGPRFALERFTFSYAPSLAAVAEIHRQAAERQHRRPQRHTLAAFGDPLYPEDAPITLRRLEGTAREIERARRHLGADGGPGTLFLREAATEAALKRLALHRYRFVHLATHGYAGDSMEGGRLPALFLGPGDGEDGVLGIDEVSDLRLDADLVVLSACGSGRGPLTPGDGLGGLTGAFLQAGASAVMATLWAVEDTHAARMMDVFYERLSDGASQARALREARLALLSDPPGSGEVHRGIGGILDPSAPPDDRARRRATAERTPRTDPFYWASFVLVGDVGDILR
ncbi:MAG: CHAT domain-containing protein [Myxococcota bacterium]